MSSHDGVPVEHPWPVRMLRTVQFGLARLRSRDGYVEASAAPFDLRFVGPSADCITRHIYRQGAHEPGISRYVVDHVRLQPGEIAIDVGANIGWYSVLLARLAAPGARILAFEPDPATYQLLQTNIAANGATQVTALNLALGEAPGTAMLHRYKASNNGRHSLSPSSPDAYGTCEVPVQTMDSVCQAQGLAGHRVRLLKVDVEGFEYFVLCGATEVLRRCDSILLEFNRGEHTEALVRLLAGAGFSASAFMDGQLIPMDFEAIAQSPTQLDLLLIPAGK